MWIQYGDTPLHTAARYGHAGVARILLSAKCSAGHTNKVSFIGPQASGRILAPADEKAKMLCKIVRRAGRATSVRSRCAHKEDES